MAGTGHLRNRSSDEAHTELVATIEGVTYRDHHDARSAETASKVIAELGGPSVVIMGGSEAPGDLALLARIVEDGGVIHALIFGNAAPRPEAALRAAGFSHVTQRPDDFDRIIRDCYAITEPGDAVVFLPACFPSTGGSGTNDASTRFRAAVGRLAQLSGSQEVLNAPARQSRGATDTPERGMMEP